MQPEIRRIIAVAAHRRCSSHCPVLIHSLGTGESFDIRPTTDGFVDLASGLVVRITDGQILIPSIGGVIDFRLTGDIGFEGYDHTGNEPFSGQAGGGASVTVYDRGGRNYFQYAVAAEDDRL
jgi:hypothetical protein